MTEATDRAWKRFYEADRVVGLEHLLVRCRRFGFDRENPDLDALLEELGEEYPVLLNLRKRLDTLRRRLSDTRLSDSLLDGKGKDLKP